MNKQVETTTEKQELLDEPFVIDGREGDLKGFKRTIKRQINSFNSQLDKIEKEYPFLEFNNEEVKGVLRNKMAQSLRDKVYPNLPPDMRRERIYEILLKIQEINVQSLFSDKWIGNHNEKRSSVKHYVSVKNSRLGFIENIDQKLFDRFALVIRTKEMKESWEDVNEFLEKYKDISEKMKGRGKWFSEGVYGGSPSINKKAFAQ